ncbi:MAG: Mov34/MPN/PAD-1 family protein [Chloroflexia bacterium]
MAPTLSQMPALRGLERVLAREYRRQLAQAARLGAIPDQVRPLLEGLRLLVEMREGVWRALREGNAGGLLELERHILTELESRPLKEWAARRLLLRLLERLEHALQEVVDGPAVSMSCREVVVPSVLLYQAVETLFPPERLLVVAGCRTGEQVQLEAAFDVTGVGSPGHVRADPDRLGRALIAMERANCFLAAWVHSHPGNGPEATRPSSTDVRQHEDWLRDYSSHLIGVICAGEWIRFWGTALDEGKVAVQVTGAGLVLEGEDGTLWRLA